MWIQLDGGLITGTILQGSHHVYRFLMSLQVEKVLKLSHLNKVEGVLDDKSGRTFILVYRQIVPKITAI